MYIKASELLSKLARVGKSIEKKDETFFRKLLTRKWELENGLQMHQSDQIDAICAELEEIAMKIYCYTTIIVQYIHLLEHSWTDDRVEVSIEHMEMYIKKAFEGSDTS